MFFFVKDSKNYKSIFTLLKIFLITDCISSISMAKRKDDRLKVDGAHHVPESQGITLEVDRRISFSIAIRAWEEFISVANVPHTRILYSRNKLKRSDW